MILYTHGFYGSTGNPNFTCYFGFDEVDLESLYNRRRQRPAFPPLCFELLIIMDLKSVFFLFLAEGVRAFLHSLLLYRCLSLAGLSSGAQSAQRHHRHPAGRVDENWFAGRRGYRLWRNRFFPSDQLTCFSGLDPSRAPWW